MEKEVINRYITNFRRHIAPFTKKDVSVKATVYPYINGALVVFEMKLNASSNTEYKSESDNMQEAMKKSDLFDNPKEATEIKSKIIWGRNLVVIIKCSDNELWTENAAKADVNALMESIAEKKAS